MNEDTKSKGFQEKDAEMCNDDGAAMATYQSQSNENQNVASTQSLPDHGINDALDSIFCSRTGTNR